MMQPRSHTRFALPLLLAGLGLVGARGAPAAAAGQVRVPADTVVHVKLDNEVSSRSAAVGDPVKATMASNDYSGFPEGTRLEGKVTEVQHASKDQPGVLAMRFDRAVLPGGRAVAIDGRLASLSDEDTQRTSNGRVVSRERSGKSKFDPKWVGYGAGGGAVLATILGGGFFRGALLGGLGGAVYSYINKQKDRGSFREVDLTPGTEFGVRLNDPIRFDEEESFHYPDRGRTSADRAGNGAVRDRGRQDRVAGDRGEYRSGSMSVLYNGRRVDFGDARPMRVNGAVYVPLAAVARAADLDYRHQAGDDFFSLAGRDGRIEGTAGNTRISMPGKEDLDLDAAPLAVDGEIYVTPEFLNRAAGLRANWDPQTRRLDLEP
jgi:hypothetical protein